MRLALLQTYFLQANVFFDGHAKAILNIAAQRSAEEKQKAL